MEFAEIAPLVIALLVGGISAGFVSGLLGIGGGSILVPILFEVFGLVGVADHLRMHLAVGTSIAVIVPTSIRSALAHKAKGSVDLDLVKTLAIPVVTGVALGAITARYSNREGLILIWIIVGTLMSLYFAFGKESWRLPGDLPHGHFLKGYGVFIGWISTLLSIGGGVFITTLMTLYGRSIRQAIGTAASLGPIVAAPATLGFIWAGWNVADRPVFSLGYVSLIGAAIIVPASVLMAPLGVRAAHGIPKSKLRLTFAIYLAIVVFRFIWNLASG